jgi:hypothetical protein
MVDRYLNPRRGSSELSTKKYTVPDSKPTTRIICLPGRPGDVGSSYKAERENIITGAKGDTFSWSVIED